MLVMLFVSRCDLGHILLKLGSSRWIQSIESLNNKGLTLLVRCNLMRFLIVSLDRLLRFLGLLHPTFGLSR
jgi:hypothetical protein